jgi:dihydrofolate reductase
VLPLALVVAIAKNGVIGRGGRLPWEYPEDRAHFLALTKGRAVIMGRRTFEETGHPLPDRFNVVVSRSLGPRPDVRTAETLSRAIELAREADPEPFVIGGTRLFEEAWPLVTHAYLTEIPDEPEGDTFLRLDRSAFSVASRREGDRGAVFLELVRRRSDDA